MVVSRRKRDNSREGEKKRSGKVVCGRITWMMRSQQDRN